MPRSRRHRRRIFGGIADTGAARNSKWYSPSSPFSKVELVRSASHTIGDAMRDLDHRGFLVGDFLIVYGDVISNLPLEAALAAHRARRAKDKNAIMTMVLREAGAVHRTKAQESRPVFVIDPTKDRCLHFEQMHSREHSEKHFVSIAPDLLAENTELEVRNDLIDCGIDICTPDVLALWSDNFDFQAPRRGFLHSVLKDYELNGKTIHTHIVDDHYAARVRNLHAYDAVSQDVISRWAYPLCPDSNLLRGQTYRFQKGNIYKEDGVILARSCVINRGTVIGKDSSIGDGSVVSNSIIGRMCYIGRNVTIEGAYIWDNAVIGDDTVIRKAVIANEASIGKRCTVEPGALISYGVRIADGITVDGSSRITRAKRKREEGEDVERAAPDPKVVGEKGDGIEYVDPDEDDVDEIVEGLVPKKSSKWPPRRAPGGRVADVIQSTISRTSLCPPSRSPRSIPRRTSPVMACTTTGREREASSRSIPTRRATTLPTSTTKRSTACSTRSERATIRQTFSWSWRLCA